MTNYEKDLRAAKLLENKELCKSNPQKVSKEYIQARDNYLGTKAIVNEIKTTIPNFVPNAAKSKWDNIEIEAITMSWYKEKGKFKFDCERTDDPAKIYFYSVYLHQIDGGVQCIADVHTEQQARDLANLLRNSVLNYKDNGFLKDEF